MCNDWFRKHKKNTCIGSFSLMPIHWYTGIGFIEAYSYCIILIPAHTDTTWFFCREQLFVKFVWFYLVHKKRNCTKNFKCFFYSIMKIKREKTINSKQTSFGNKRKNLQYSTMSLFDFKIFILKVTASGIRWV